MHDYAHRHVLDLSWADSQSQRSTFSLLDATFSDQIMLYRMKLFLGLYIQLGTDVIACVAAGRATKSLV